MIQTLFLQAGPLSDPGPLAAKWSFGADPATLVQLVQNATLHVYWAERYGLQPTPQRQAQPQLRSLSARLRELEGINPAPLSRPRAEADRVWGTCRDFTLLFVALLRQAGVPARARCGFATYFVAGQGEDHWVAEWFNQAEQRWVLTDPQLDSLQKSVLGVDFDPLDLPRDRFVVAGVAWRRYRGGDDPDHFGIFDLRGPWFIAGNVYRDLASLNGIEVLPWDTWGANFPLPGIGMDLASLDQAAALTMDPDGNWDDLTAFYRTRPGFKVQNPITSFPGGPNRPSLVETIGL